MIKIILLIFFALSLPLWVLAQVPLQKAKSKEVLVVSPELLSTQVVEKSAAEAKTAQPAIQEFYAKKVLITEGELLTSSGTVLEFKAGESIELTEGFEVDENTTFTAEIVEAIATTETLSAATFKDSETEAKAALNQWENTFTLFPNPVVEQLVIRYELVETTPLKITLLTLTGSLLQVLQTLDMQAAGAYEETFAVTNVPAGVYFVSLQTGGQTRTQRIIVQ